MGYFLIGKGNVSTFPFFFIHLLPGLSPVSIRCSSPSLSPSPRKEWSRLVPRKLWEIILLRSHRKTFGFFTCASLLPWASFVSSVFQFLVGSNKCCMASAMQFITARRRKPDRGYKTRRRTKEPTNDDEGGCAQHLSCVIYGYVKTLEVLEYWMSKRRSHLGQNA